jgi:RNA ligase
VFPVIKHIDDVLPHIADKPEIARIEKDGYTVLDYIYAGVSTFDNPYARECRGIKFDSQGNLIGRPFHKFFNLNEKEETKFENQDWTESFTLFNKWDGSMIHPALVHGELVFMTRKGVTDVALQAMKECEYNADEMIALLQNGFTPIYEFISPNNKIVIHYNEARLVPLNLRDMRTGTYFSGFSETDGPIGDHCNGSIEEILDSIKRASDLEGTVIQFHQSQRFIKFKADDYCALHRVLDETAHEKRVLALIMDDKLDDVIPLIAPARAEHLKIYAAEINETLVDQAKFIVTHVENCKRMSQKDFAVDVQRTFRREIHGFMFKARVLEVCDVPSVVAMFKEFFKKTLTTQVKVDSWRNFLGAPKFEMQVD